MSYDVLAISAHPDDIEVAMGGTAARLSGQGHRFLIVDLCDGEPTRHAKAGVRQKEAQQAAQILGVDRVTLDLQDRLIVDSVEARLKVAQLIRRHRPRWVFATTACGVHPDHKAVTDIAEGAVFYARLPNWERVPGGELLAETEPWVIERLFFYYCRMEPVWDQFDFAVDISSVYEKKQQAMAAYKSVFSGNQAQMLSKVEIVDRYYGNLVGVECAEIFRHRSPAVIDDLAVFGKAKFG